MQNIRNKREDIMQVKVADSAGFCFGVKRAVDLVYEETEKSRGRVYTMGPIIHNEQLFNICFIHKEI